MRTVLLVGCLMAILGASCALRQLVQRQNTFDYDAHKPYTQDGTTTVKGRGVVRPPQGKTVTCAGSKVLLLPATPFFRKALDRIRTGEGLQIEEKQDPRYQALFKESQCDRQGNFTFESVPAGHWFVMMAVQGAVGSAQQGGTLLREISVVDGETAQVRFTEENIISD